MRAIWKGAVSFGLVNVPVRLYSATENHDVQFRQVHREDGGRIKYKRTCSIDGEEVSYDDIAKGYETEDGDMVVLTDDDFADLPSKSSKEIGVTKFVPADQVDPMWLDKSYYLEPDKSATKPYILLRDALVKEKRMAIVTVSIRTRMTMAVLRVRDGVIVMQTMLWPDEIRAADFATVTEEHATKQEMDMAKMLIDQLAGDYDPGEYEDDYALAVKELVRAKVEGGEVRVSAAEPEESGEVVDLLAALARSVEKAKACARRGAGGGEEQLRRRRAPRASRRRRRRRRPPPRRRRRRRPAAKKTGEEGELTARCPPERDVPPNEVHAIGAPARRALTNAGLTTWDAVDAAPDADLLACTASARRPCGSCAAPDESREHAAGESARTACSLLSTGTAAASPRAADRAATHTLSACPKATPCSPSPATSTRPSPARRPRSPARRASSRRAPPSSTATGCCAPPRAASTCSSSSPTTAGCTCTSA